MNAFEIRSSSWGELFDCAHRWEGRYPLGMTQPASFPMHLGTACHEGTRVYDQHVVDNDPISPDDAAGVFVDELRHPKEEVRRHSKDMSVNDAETIGRTLIERYCRGVAPRFTYRAVELRPEPLEVGVGDTVIRLTGQLDRMRVKVDGAGVGIADIKTGRTAVSPDGIAKTKGHGLQLGVYELLAEYTLHEKITIPATIIGLQTIHKARVGLGEIYNPRTGLIGTEEKPGLIQMAASMLKTGIFPPNPQSMFCSERTCPRWYYCDYHD